MDFTFRNEVERITKYRRSNKLSGNYWPVHTKPFYDELLSSWIARIAMSHGIKLHTFSSMLWPKINLLNSDIDRRNNSALFRVLSEKTNTLSAGVHNTSLISYEGKVFDELNQYGLSSWILPQGIYHREHLLNGLQYCPLCLKEDYEAYFRKSWRLSFVTVCHKHKCLLLDRCQQCGASVNYIRCSVRKDRTMLDSITRCHICKKHLFEKTNDTWILNEDFMLFSEQLLIASETGWFEYGNFKMYSILFFHALKLLVKLVRSKRVWSKSYRFLKRRNMDIREPGSMFDFLDTGERFEIMKFAYWLIDKWPVNFIYYCYTNGILSSDLLRDMKYVPYWYWSIVNEHFYRPDYKVTKEEILSVIGYYKAGAEEITEKKIASFFGSKELFRKRKELSKYELKLILKDL